MTNRTGGCLSLVIAKPLRENMTSLCLPAGFASSSSCKLYLQTPSATGFSETPLPRCGDSVPEPCYDFFAQPTVCTASGIELGLYLSTATGEAALPAGSMVRFRCD